MSAMENKVVVPLDPHKSKNVDAYVGIVVALGSWAMMFAALFFAYAATRVQARQWPPPGMPVAPKLLPSISTAIIVASSVTVQSAVNKLRKLGDRAMFQRLFAVTIFLGLGFLEVQWLLWSELKRRGLYLTSGVYGSILCGFTYVHAAHIVAGLGALLWVFVRAKRGKYGPHDWFGVRSVAYFWHFVGVVWVVMFVGLFLV